jgi:hypothetical protein
MAIRTSYPSWQEAIRAIGIQWNVFFSVDRMTRGVDAKDDLVVDDNTQGLVLKSPNGHYWRVTVGDTGTLSTTDLGTTKP